MRARVLSLDAVGGDPISRRLPGDDPVGPRPFAWSMTRTHPSSSVVPTPRQDAGTSVGDTSKTIAGEPTVVDWRADVSLPFYRATRTEPLGVSLRRRYGYDRGALTAYEDEHLSDASEGDRRSAILAQEIQRPRTGPMRDIVATIQPEQDAVVRADLGVTVCVQGAPGTGKTAVGLHRVAFLLYAHRERLRRSGVLFVGPNRSFLSYIGQVLPALGEYDVAQTTVDDLTSGPPVRRIDPPEVALLKGDARLAEVVRRAVWSHVQHPTEALVVPVGSRRWRVSADRAASAIDSLRARDVRYGSGRALIAQRLAHEVLVQMEREGVTTDDRDQDKVARHKDVRAYVDAVWPAVDPTTLLLRLLSDPAALARHSDGLLAPDEVRLLCWPKPARGPASAPWSLADTVLVDEAADLVDRTPSLGHVVLDEAQDLSPMQLRAVGRRCSTGSATVLGDLAQGTTVWAASRWDEALAHLGKSEAHLEELSRGFRVPSAVIDFAARLLPHLAVGLEPPFSVREDPGLLDVVATADIPTAVVSACRGCARPSRLGGGHHGRRRRRRGSSMDVRGRARARAARRRRG